MDRRHFLRMSLLATGSALIGGGAIFSCKKSDKPEAKASRSAIEHIHTGHKKNVLVLMSAGTRNGNTNNLTDAYIKGLIEKGHTVTKVYLGSMQVAGCLGCGACQRNASRKCVIPDDMQEIYPLFAECDTLVMASPLYFWTITSRLKAFIERLYAISIEDKYPEKEMVLLMSAGDDNDSTFEQPIRYFHLISDVFGGKEAGIYCAGGCTGCDKPLKHIDQKHLDNAYRMGLEL